MSRKLIGGLVGLAFFGMAVTVVAPNPAQATIVSGHANFDETGYILTDYTSGLQWLDLSQTWDKSYEYVTARFGTGEAYDGWGVATGLQFQQLIVDWDGGSLPTELTTAVFPSSDSSFDHLITLLGDTYLNFDADTDNAVGCDGVLSCGTHYTHGLLQDTFLVYNYSALIYDAREWTPDDGGDYALAHASQYFPTANYTALGTFLVRPIPEPTTLTLFAFGLAGLGFIRRRRKLA